MNNAKRYETAVTQLLSSLGADVHTDGNLRILTAAEHVDNLIATIADDSARLARNLTKFAEEIDYVNYDVTPPTQSSLIADISENTGRLRAKREGLYDLIAAVHGPEGSKAFRRSLA